MLILRLLIALTLILFGGGLLALYIKARNLINIINVLLLAGLSIFTAVNVPAVVGFLDYAFNDSKLIGIDQFQLSFLAFWGLFISSILNVYLFIASFKKDGFFQKLGNISSNSEKGK